jgi:ATP-dependent Clp protease ATP-binding subunit ClpB
MNFNNRTTKAAEALNEANNLAATKKHNSIDPLHILFTMLRQEDGYIPMVVTKSDRDVNIILDATKKALDSLPTIDGNVQISMSPVLHKILIKAEDEMKSMGDHYLTTEHLFLALLQIDSNAKKICNEFGITDKIIRDLLSTMRNGSIIDSPDPENTLDAL